MAVGLGSAGSKTSPEGTLLGKTSCNGDSWVQMDFGGCSDTHFDKVLLNCLIWDTSLGQAAGVNHYIHLLTNERDTRVTPIFYKYLLPI